MTGNDEETVEKLREWLETEAQIARSQAERLEESEGEHDPVMWAYQGRAKALDQTLGRFASLFYENK